MSSPVISSRNIIARFRDAFSGLAECDQDFADFRSTFTEAGFVSHAAGFITSSLWRSEELLDAAGERNETQ